MTTTTSFMESVAALETLARLPIMPASEVGLARAEKLLDVLGQPHRAFQSVHVAGSSGKGSTTTIIASILQASGLRTGMFRSPHLERYTERISIDGNDISEDDWLRLFEEVRPVVEAMTDNQLPGYSLGRPSFFEVLFALACLHFARSGVEWAAMETGMGGRLDATNTSQAAAAVITNVSLEHTHILGSTVEAIAREKVAIIKSSAPAITGCTPPALEVVCLRATEYGAPLITVPDDVSAHVVQSDFDGLTLDVRARDYQFVASTRLRGSYQAANVALAAAATGALAGAGQEIEPRTIKAGIEDALVPGRMEVIPGRPLLILDGAHNPAAAVALAGSLAPLLKGRPATLVFSALADKDAAAMAAPLAPLFGQVIVTEAPGTDRGAPLDRLAGVFTQFGAPEIVCDVPRALERARQLTPDDGVVVVAGSMYLVGAARSLSGARAG